MFIRGQGEGSAFSRAREFFRSSWINTRDKCAGLYNDAFMQGTILNAAKQDAYTYMGVIW